MAAPLLAAAGVFVRKLAKNALLNKAKDIAGDKIGGMFRAEMKSEWLPKINLALTGIMGLIFIFLLAVSGGAAGNHMGVNNPREPEGPSVECPPGEECLPEDIPPPTGDCAGIVQTALAERARGVINGDPRILEYTDGRIEPWCADFVSWVHWQSGNRLNPSRTAFRYSRDREAGREPGARRLYNYFSGSFGRPLSPTEEPRPGDVVYFNWAGGDDFDSDHIGIVVSYNAGNRTVTTVEGNTSTGTRGGRGVGGRTIRVDSRVIQGFARPAQCE